MPKKKMMKKGKTSRPATMKAKMGSKKKMMMKKKY